MITKALSNVLFAFCVLGAVCGCRQENDERVAALENRIAELEKHIMALDRQLIQNRLPAGVRMSRGPASDRSVPTKAVAPTKEQIEERERLRQEVRRKIEERNAALREEKARKNQSQGNVQ